jgi:hypothetical protein
MVGEFFLKMLLNDEYGWLGIIAVVNEKVDILDIFFLCN